MSNSLILDDELLSVYYDFLGGTFDRDVVKSLLKYYSGKHITNVAQLERIGKKDASLFSQLLSAGFTSQPLEVLVEKSDYKIVLSRTNGVYPYFKIGDVNFCRDYCFSYAANEDRSMLVKYLATLCLNASFIVVYDQYFFTKNQSLWSRFFNEVVPKKSLTLINCNNQMAAVAGKIKSIHSSWKIKSDSEGDYSGCHDRYLRIDDRVEVVFSSGLEYLFCQDKELNCIIRLLGS